MTNMEDPLEGYKGLSLFPQTFASHPNPPKPYHPDDLLSVHNFLISLPVQDPEKLMEQAKGILAYSAQTPHPEIQNDVAMASKATDEVVTEKVKEVRRERRPGLDRKRPRFSLLPTSSKPSVDLEPTLDIDKLKDPDEFFKAFDRLQNAKKEIAKQTGQVLTDSNHYGTAMIPRPRRPGIPGRSRTVKYKHLYPTTSSQETLQEGIPSSCDCESQQETTSFNMATQMEERLENVLQQTEQGNFLSEEMELDVVKAENKINNLLEELLAQDYRVLDGDAAITLLQERLQIKPPVIEKLNLPEMPDIQRIDLEATGVNLTRSRNVLSDIHNLLKGTSKTPLKQKKTEGSVSSYCSPTPPKSPFASLSLLKKRILKSNSPTDPFSAVDIVHSIPQNVSPIVNTSVDMAQDPIVSDKLKSLVIEDDNAVSDISASKTPIEELTVPSDQFLNYNLTNICFGGDGATCESSAELKDYNAGMDEGFINENLGQHDADADAQFEGPNELDDTKTLPSVQPDSNIDDIAVEKSNNISSLSGLISPAAVEDHAMDGCSEISNYSSQEMQNTAPERPNKKNQEPSVASRNERSSKKSTKVIALPSKGQKGKVLSRRQSIRVEDHAVDGCAHVQNDAPEQPNEESSLVSNNEQTNRKSIKAESRPLKRRKVKVHSKRQSLAASGTSWETGLRRSTRIKSRPLEYWKGEKFLYGRVHSSLPTVIGIKYESPGKDDGKATMKVKSFVSDEYRDLIELAM